MTTKDATAFRTDKIDSAENNHNTAVTAKGSDVIKNKCSFRRDDY